MQFVKYYDKVEITKGFYKGQKGVVIGNFLKFLVFVLRDEQLHISTIMLFSRLRKIEDNETNLVLGDKEARYYEVYYKGEKIKDITSLKFTRKNERN